MANLGYARVSTDKQDLDLQIDELKAFQIDKLFSEKVSGKNIDDRPEFQKLMDYCREGDVIVATKLDRIARSTKDLMNIVHALDEKGVVLKVIQQGIDSSTHVGKMMLGMLGLVAEFERSLINERSMEGLRRAKAAGIKSGPKPKLNSEQLDELVRMFEKTNVSKNAIANHFGLTRASVYRLYKQHKMK